MRVARNDSDTFLQSSIARASPEPEAPCRGAIARHANPAIEGNEGVMIDHVMFCYKFKKTSDKLK